MRFPGLAALLSLAPSGASACSVCFGNSPGNKGLIDGFWWGILLLLSITMCMVAGVAWLLYKVEKDRAASEVG